jgi:hypothetical protein
VISTIRTKQITNFSSSDLGVKANNAINKNNITAGEQEQIVTQRSIIAFPWERAKYTLFMGIPRYQHQIDSIACKIKF